MGLFSKGAQKGKTTPGGEMLEVLMCVNTWEHVWLRDYGVGGKREFLERWWDVVDWNVVEGRIEESRAVKRMSEYTGSHRRGFL
jgi:Fe-Mn family superoxide dismutase